ncbi:MAG: hypothetical protein QOD35_1039 [Nocardioidaceae bacterium]|nr:hypothetical protein [Nocardioidaceae bacterium]
MPRPVSTSRAYLPALDGIRAIAVLAVLGYHFGVPWLAGGLLGVGVFFTLSGCLITGILLSAYERTGGLELRRFWVHRARRLLPGLVLMLVVVLGTTALAQRGSLDQRWDQTLAAIFYVSNWTTIAGNVSYFDHFAGPGPLDHLWSLAVEEQFYLLWPLALLLLVRVVKLPVLKVARWTLVLGAVSFVLLALLASPGFDNTRAYEGTDTRAGELLVGAALAMVYGPLRHPLRIKLATRVIVDVAAVAALIAMACLMMKTSEYSLFLYRGGLVLLSLASAVLIAAVSYPASLVGRALGVAPLRWVGERSYGLYLWHMPIVAVISQSTLVAHPVRTGVLLFLFTLLMADLSWRLVENPIRQHGLKVRVKRTSLRLAPGRRPAVLRRVTEAAAVGAFAIALLSITAAVSPDDTASTLRPLPPTPHHRAAGTAPSSRGSAAAVGRLRTSCRSVVHVGDSTSLGLIDPNYLSAKDRIPAQYRDVGVRHVGTDILGARSIVEKYEGQPNADEATRSRMVKGYHGCWVFAMGTNEVANQYVGGVVPLDERIDRLMHDVHGLPTMWLTVKSRLSSGPWGDDQMRLWNAALLRACSRYPNMRVYDWRSQVQDSWYISDGIHYTSAGYQQRARRTAEALAIAFPEHGPSPHNCFVRP